MDKIPESSVRPCRDGSSNAAASALCDFLLLLDSDESTGCARPLGEYLTRFPGYEVEVAREYLARKDRERAPSAPAPRPSVFARYQPGPIIGRGGMGEVRKARDLDLDRELAMKTLRSAGPRARKRFLREASVTGSLDHPGVVPVHDLGVDDAGQPFFTMKHVEGIDLDAVFELVHRKDPRWTLARAIEVLIKVCDTVAFAHSRGIVHRDLKPSNIRVGPFGEVYVMDWGLARVITDATSQELVDVEIEPHLPPGSDVLTLEGDVLGTPTYMAPEQAEGRNGSVGKSADVYSVGAMLYQLLTGRRPYATEGRKRSQREVLALVRTRAPESPRVLAPGAPVELAAICEKAMQRAPLQRYAEVGAVAQDLRAFLDRRVVSAYDASLFERLLKWTRRNLSLVIPLLVIVLAGAAAAFLVRQNRLENRQRLFQLSRSQLVAVFDTFWPPQAASVKPLERWLEMAEEVLKTRVQDQAALEELKRRTLPRDPDAPAERGERTRLAERVRQRRDLIRYFERMLEQVDRGERLPPEHRDRAWIAEQVAGNTTRVESELLEQPAHLTFRFADDEDQIQFEALTLLLSEQEKLMGAGRPFGLVDIARWGVGASRRVEEYSLERARRAWEEARLSIADRSACPMYGGLELRPQPGLVPIGRDPRSGLWEFAHVLSGEVPVRSHTGLLQIDERSAIVLVLIPGGNLLRGSQRENGSARNYDPWSEANSPLAEEVDLLPFFLSKYELTQAQYQRVAGRNPSWIAAGDPRWKVDALHPVESLALDDARRFLLFLGLVLPTEAQWECGARAGTDTPWSCGVVPESIEGHANIADRSAVAELHVRESEMALLPGLDDGFAYHAPVGSFAPNAFGLYDTLGNVREWCRDVGPFDYRHAETHLETGERLYEDDGTRAVRGGSYMCSALRARSAARDQVGPSLRGHDLGIRPAREIER